MLPDIIKMNIELSNGISKIIVDNFNQRIKIAKLNGDTAELLDKLHPFITKHKVGKLFCVADSEQVALLKEHDFIIEAKIGGLLNGGDGYFLSKFFIPERKITAHIPEEEEVLIKSREYLLDDFTYQIQDEYIIRNAGKQDADELAALYDSVFETYPSELNNPDFIKSIMDNDVMFKAAVCNGKIVSAASADMDIKHFNAEITDCATIKTHRGAGLMGRLILELEKELRKIDYRVLYSTARSMSTGINIVFAKHGYEYGGRLVNHCHICGQFENMNIWLKTLR